MDEPWVDKPNRISSGHCENKYENSRKGKYVKFLSSTQPFIEVMTKLCAWRKLESKLKEQPFCELPIIRVEFEILFVELKNGNFNPSIPSPT